ncbi:MAG: GNAT family N-acetyltransferase [Rubripirellula sp.]
MFTIETTNDIAELLSNADAWNRLSRGVPFRETSWLGAWWEAMNGGRQAYVLIARDSGGNMRGLLPLYQYGSGVLAMIGDGEACTDHVSILAGEADAAEIGYAMGQHLAKTASDPKWGWEVIDIDGVVEGDEPMTALASGLKEGGATLHAQSRMSVWYRAADSCWDEHLKRHGKTQRRQMRRWADQLKSMEKVVATTDAEVDELLGFVIEMHQRRWVAAGEAGSFANESFRSFMIDTAKQFLSRDQLYLAVLKHEGTPIAGELKFIGGNKVLYSYSAGYDIDFAELEPGRLMCVDGLLEMYERGFVGLDFMRGDETYKSRYSTESHRLFRMRAIAPTLMPRLRHAAWCTGFELKQWVRRQSGRPVIVVQDPTSLAAINMPIVPNA